MTILVFEIRVPSFFIDPSNRELWFEITKLLPSFLGYILSFALLFTYWRAHHFFTSIYAKNVDSKLANINALYFMLVALVPFSTSLISHFGKNQLAITIFGLNIILTGLTLYWMRRYVLYSDNIKNPEISDREIHGSTIRTLVPVIFGLIAIPLSFVSTTLALSLFTLIVIFNLSPWSTRLVERIFK